MRIASRLATTVGLALAAIALGAASASAATFSNNAAIAIPSGPGNATPYPSQIAVSGQTTPISDLNVNLNGLSHTSSGDVGVVLVAPGGQALALMNCSGFSSAPNVNLKLDDSAATPMPSGLSYHLASGSFKPTDQCNVLRSYPAPGPGSTYAVPGPGPLGGTATLASTFNGASANGTWSLFVRDFTASDSGQFVGGWSLEISPDPAKKKCKKGRKLKKGKCVKKKKKKKKKK